MTFIEIAWIAFVAVGILWIVISDAIEFRRIGREYACRKPKISDVTLRKALMLACERVADGPQLYHEANTPDGWADVYIAAALEGKTPDQVVNENSEKAEQAYRLSKTPQAIQTSRPEVAKG